MRDALIKKAVRTMFVLTSRGRALGQTRRLLDRYSRLADGLIGDAGQRSVEVPPMPGIDEDMRCWSFYMILEHNTIVNRAISAVIAQLVRGEALHDDAVIDVKKGVMPSGAAGPEQVPLFREAIADHLGQLATLGRLRGTRRAPHVIFGDFDAHQWTCMLPFHLMLHYRQAVYVVRNLPAGSFSAVTSTS